MTLVESVTSVVYHSYNTYRCVKTFFPWIHPVSFFLIKEGKMSIAVSLYHFVGHFDACSPGKFQTCYPCMTLFSAFWRTNVFVFILVFYHCWTWMPVGNVWSFDFPLVKGGSRTEKLKFLPVPNNKISCRDRRMDSGESHDSRWNQGNNWTSLRK